MLNLLRKFLRPTLREQLEDGVREGLRRYADRRTSPNLRVYVSEDLVPDDLEPPLWSRDEAEHLRRFALQWAEDNNVSRAGLRVEVVLLDTKREFAFVKPLGLEATTDADPGPPGTSAVAAPLAPVAPTQPQTAVLDVVSSPSLEQPLEIRGEMTVGRRSGEVGVVGIGDRFMSSRHARFHVSGGTLFVTDLDSKNRTFLNERPIPPHQQIAVATGDHVRLGTTTLRLARVVV